MRVAKTKALISFANCEADLRLCFHICKYLVFSRPGSFKHEHAIQISHSDLLPWPLKVLNPVLSFNPSPVA